MLKFDDNMVGARVSVLIDGKGGKQENYVGRIKDVFDNFIMIDSSSPAWSLKWILIRTDRIQSLWLYNEDVSPKPPSSKKQKTKRK